MLNLTRANRENPNASAPFFSLTSRGVRVELADDAVNNGKRNLPASDAVAPNEFEAAIIRQHEQDHLADLERTHGILGEQEAVFTRAERQMPTTADLDGLVEKADAEIDHDLVSNVSLTRKFEEYDRQHGNFNLFQVLNGLVREPERQQSPIWRLAILTVLFVLETAANATFFAAGNAFGYAGGFLLAAFIALVNVGGGFFCGLRCLPYLHHIQRGNRRRALVVLVLYGLFVIVFNLVVAHFRDLHTVSAGAARDSVGALVRGPFDLRFHSFLMLAVGLISWVLAVWEGFVAEDRYPGYTKVHQEFVRARDAYDLDKGTALQQVLGKERAIPIACDSEVQRAEALVETMAQALLATQQAAHRHDTKREKTQASSEIYLRKYRDLNRIARRAPAPTYFDEFPTFPDLLDRGVIEAMTERLQFARRALETLKAHARGIKADSRSRVADIVRRFDEFLAARLPRYERDPALEQASSDDPKAIGGQQA